MLGQLWQLSVGVAVATELAGGKYTMQQLGVCAPELGCSGSSPDSHGLADPG